MFVTKQSEECISDLMFDQWCGDCLDVEASARLRTHLTDCVRCALRHEVLSAQHAAFLERVPSWQILRAEWARQPLREARTRRRALWMSSAGLAAIALLSWIVVVQNAPAGVRPKGGPHIAAYVKRGDRVISLLDGDLVQPGDYVRFTYSSDVPSYFALLNRDARTAATYYPQGEESVRVRAGRDIALDFSVELDEEQGPERVHAVFCDRPQALEPLRRALQLSGQLPPLPNCRIDVLTLIKRKAQE